ncbi:MAG: hypothetical protein KGH87_09540, partial [Thaumarchaeota archaeon]|nr:hypothetical protein [Nitrososphaerota archaeon]
QDVIFNGTLVDACNRHLGVEKVYFTAEQLNITKEVTSDARGKFNINFTIPANTESGNYTSKIEMYQYPFAYHLSGVETLYLKVGTNNTQIVPESPLQQFKSGITATNVKCADGFTLVIKSEDGSPACVTDSGMGRMTRQGWWAWNDKVGDTVVNTPEKRNFDNKSCGITDTMSSIVGTNGFVLDDLPVNGTTFYGADISRMIGGITQFAIHSGTAGKITLTYDFNPYPGSNCKVTTSDVISNVYPSRPNATISELIGSPDIMKVDENSVNTSIPPLGDSGDILLNLASVENLNDHVVKVTYQIFTKPQAQLGKSYYVEFWWHSAVVITVGNTLYTGHAFEGTHYG